MKWCNLLRNSPCIFLFSGLFVYSPSTFSSNLLETASNICKGTKSVYIIKKAPLGGICYNENVTF